MDFPSPDKTDARTMSTPAIEIKGLRKDYPVGIRRVVVRALEHFDLRVEENQVFGLLGPNGSGKSTTVKCLLGLLSPSAGSIRVFGKPSGHRDVRKKIGYLPESPAFYRFLSGFELVTFYGKLSGLRGRDLRERSKEALEAVELSDAAQRRVETYSKGMLQRLGMAQALVHHPPLLILDEPTSGVDPLGSELVAGIIQRLKAEGKTVLLCSHQLNQVEALCDRVAVLHQGRCLIQGRVESLLETPDQYTVSFSGLGEEARARLESWIREQGGRVTGSSPGRKSLEQRFLEWARAARKGGISK